MTTQSIDGISFKIKQPHDFSFLSRYGQVFCVFAQNDSGNISFGVDSGKERYFIKVAGAETAESCTSAQKAVEALKAAMPIYKDLSHPHLVRLISHFTYGNLYAAVFEWSAGDCLFDYWNFEKYKSNSELSPRERFKKLPAPKKLHAFDAIFDFLIFVESKGYVAVDFYDGSIMYDFDQNTLTICDIDFFRKSPTINDMGNFWGTKRLKSPEEYILGAKIDSVTNVFTIGALLFHFFGSYTDHEIKIMSKENAFFPCRYETWELSESLYNTALKAVNKSRAKRYESIIDFYEAWKL